MYTFKYPLYKKTRIGFARCQLDNEIKQFMDGYSIYPYKVGNKNYWNAASGTKRFNVHRLVYEFFHGSIPQDLEIHHIDHNPNNNTKNNLMAISNTDHLKQHMLEKLNNINDVPLIVTNKSGYRFISWDTKTSKWRVVIRYFGKVINCGRFSKIEDAIKTRDLKIDELLTNHSK